MEKKFLKKLLSGKDKKTAVSPNAHFVLKLHKVFINCCLTFWSSQPKSDNLFGAERSQPTAGTERKPSGWSRTYLLPWPDRANSTSTKLSASGARLNLQGEWNIFTCRITDIVIFYVVTANLVTHSVVSHSDENLICFCFCLLSNYFCSVSQVCNLCQSIVPQSISHNSPWKTGS